MPQFSLRFIKQPAKNSTVVMLTALSTHLRKSDMSLSLIKYISTKQMPPHMIIVQWVQPRQIISTEAYNKPPKMKLSMYSNHINSLLYFFLSRAF